MVWCDHFIIWAQNLREKSHHKSQKQKLNVSQFVFLSQSTKAKKGEKFSEKRQDVQFMMKACVVFFFTLSPSECVLKTVFLLMRGQNTIMEVKSDAQEAFVRFYGSCKRNDSVIKVNWLEVQNGGRRSHKSLRNMKFQPFNKLILHKLCQYKYSIFIFWNESQGNAKTFHTEMHISIT